MLLYVVYVSNGHNHNHLDKFFPFLDPRAAGLFKESLESIESVFVQEDVFDLLDYGTNMEKCNWTDKDGQFSYSVPVLDRIVEAYNYFNYLSEDRYAEIRKRVQEVIGAPDKLWLKREPESHEFKLIDSAPSMYEGKGTCRMYMCVKCGYTYHTDKGCGQKYCK
jgi:hypothetical protein